jgi:TRAP-type transport system small permease protein
MSADMSRSMSSMPGSEAAPWAVSARSKLIRFDQMLMQGLRLLLGALLGAMAVIIFANVVMRYVTGGSLVWAEEVARYLMIWLTLLGCGLVLRTGGHIAIENLQDALPTLWAQVLRAVIIASLIACAIGMMVLGVQYMLRSMQQLTASTQIPFGLIYAAMPVGGLIMLWCSIALVASYVPRREFDNEPSNDEHQEGVQV